MADFLPLSLANLLEERAGDAIQQWGLPRRVPILIKYRENAVFRVVRGNGNFAGLRLHRPGYHGEQALRSELAWMRALHEAGLGVPEPIPTTEGDLLVTLPAAGEGGVQYADLLTWLPGVPLGESGENLTFSGPEAGTLFYKIGAAMARLHAVSDGWRPPRNFVRPRWDRDGLLGESPVWGRFWDCPLLTDAQQETLGRLRTRLAEALAALDRTGPDFGLIHADLVRENILVHEGEVSFIDFDDAGYGYRMFEIATALLKNRLEPEFETLKSRLISGYRSVRPLADAALKALPMFLTLRSLTYIGWISSRTEMPGSLARINRYYADTMAFAAAPGGDGSPFL